MLQEKSSITTTSTLCRPVPAGAAFSRATRGKLLAACALLSAAVTAQHTPRHAATAPSARGERIWIGPKAFVRGRELRPDFFSVLTDPTAWDEVLGQTDVFKSYIMFLPDIPLPDKQTPELTDPQLETLARFFRNRGIKVAFEVGGLRCSKRICGDTAGEQYARFELHWLRRWLHAGGTIDFLTTDHAVMMNMRGVGFKGPGLDPNRPCKMSVAQLTQELADYFVTVHREIPNARLGVIESLGYFQITGADGTLYKQTDPKLPVWTFPEFFDGLLAAMRARGLHVDHFHIDFGYGGAAHDGRKYRGGGLDFGRIRAVEDYVHSKGVKSGIIINAFHDAHYGRATPNPDPRRASRQAWRNTLAFLRGYLAAGGASEHILLQTWQPYPDRTGPEDEPYTVLNIARDALRLLKQRRFRPPARPEPKP